MGSGQERPCSRCSGQTLRTGHQLPCESSLATPRNRFDRSGLRALQLGVKAENPLLTLGWPITYIRSRQYAMRHVVSWGQCGPPRFTTSVFRERADWMMSSAPSFEWTCRVRIHSKTKSRIFLNRPNLRARPRTLFEYFTHKITIDKVPRPCYNSADVSCSTSASRPGPRTSSSVVPPVSHGNRVQALLRARR